MKAVVTIILLFFFFIPVALFLLVLRKGLKGAKADEWSGEVIDKLYKTGEDDGKISEYYSIVFKTDKGERKIAVSKEDYGKWKAGDKAKKAKGEFGVKKI